MRFTRDLDAAEEAVQDAYVQTLRSWSADGVPARPGAWVRTVAQRTALNAMRRRQKPEAKLALLIERRDRTATTPFPMTDSPVLPTNIDNRVSDPAQT